MRTRSAVSTTVTLLVIVVIILAAVAGYGFVYSGHTVTTTVGGAGTTVTSTVNGGGSTVTAAQQTLAQEAQAEGGSVTVYGVIDASAWSSVIQPAFQQQYPWAHVTYDSLSGAQVGTKALSDFKAGSVTADVLISGLTQLEATIQGGAVQQWNDSAFLYSMGYTSSNVDPQGYWSPGYVLPGIIIYNKDLVSPSQVPTSYTDLANPIWKGKVVIQDPSSLGGVGATFSTLYPIMGNASFTTFMHNLAANNPVIVSSNGVSLTDVQSGQYPVGMGQLNDYIAAQKAGNSTLGAVFAAPVVGLPNVVCITKNAPHPYMAELLTQWLASIPGQQALAQTGRTPQNSLLAAQALAGYVPSNVSIVVADYNNPSFYTDTGFWSGYFHNIFG